MEGRGNPLPSKKGPVRSGWWCSTLFFSRDLLRVKRRERSVLLMIGKTQGRPDICTVFGPDRYHSTLSAPYRSLQAEYLHHFRTGSLSAPSPCQPRTRSGRLNFSTVSGPDCYHPSFTLSAPYRSGRPDICKVSGRDRYHSTLTLSAPYRSGQDGCLHIFRTGSVSAPSPRPPRT